MKNIPPAKLDDDIPPDSAAPRLPVEMPDAGGQMTDFTYPEPEPADEWDAPAGSPAYEPEAPPAATWPSVIASPVGYLGYLDALDRAARQALHHRQAARLAEQGAWLHSTVPSYEGLDGAYEFPPGVVARLHGETLAIVRARTDEMAAFTTAWYARAVMAAWRAILDGRAFTGRDLEDEVFDPAELPGLTGVSDDLPQYRPDLLDPAELTTGQPEVDQAVVNAHQQLATAYTAAETAAILQEIMSEGDLDTEEQRSVFDQAVQLADQIPELLTWWADAAFTALRHRAIATGLPDTAR